MNLVCKPYTALCRLEVFTINGIKANYEDFGTKEDRSPETAEEYGCGNMRFISFPSTLEVLQKYSITEKDYQDVCEILEDKLSFRECGWCI